MTQPSARRLGRRGRRGAALPAGEPRVDRRYGRGQVQGGSGATGLDTRGSALDCLPETQQMPMDAERPSPDPRSTAHQQTTPRPADSFVQSAGLTPNELAICRSGGCRMIRAGRGTEFAPDRSASSPTREVLRNNHTSTRVTRRYSMASASRKPAIATHPIVPAGPKHPASPDARSRLPARNPGRVLRSRDLVCPMAESST